MRVLIFPFAKAMRGGEDHPEQLERLRTANDIWIGCKLLGHDVKILCSTGLINFQGESVAQTMKAELIKINAGDSYSFQIPPEDIILGEELSTHTGENIRLSKSILFQCWDVVVCVSSPGFLFLPGHIDRIEQLMKNIVPGINFELVESRPYGSTCYRIIRGITEFVLIKMLWIDPEARLLDHSRDKRIQNARSKP